MSSEEERQVVGEYDLHPAIKDGLHFFDLFYADNTMSRWQNIHKEAGTRSTLWGSGRIRRSMAGRCGR